MQINKILVTGGAGMVGSNLVKRLVKEGKEVLVVDNLWRGKISYLNDETGKPVIPLETHFFNRDLSEKDACDDLAGMVDCIVHLADVVAGIDYVFNNQGYLFRQNLLINSNVISSANKAKDTLNGFVYAGTACSFPLTRQNSLEVIPLREDELYPAMPESAYGWSKLMGQYEAELLEKEANVPVSVLMFHNIYGAPCDFGERSQVIPALIRKAINYPQEAFHVWGSGNQGRAFIHVDDAVEALWLAINKGLGRGTIQIGPSVCTSIREIAEMIVKISAKPIDIFYDLSRPEGDKARSADFTKAAKLLSWSPKISLEEGLRRQYEWIKHQLME
ncbi:MAG: NAD-dependent epimerase/dehydratase family protein [Tannerella sp.]|nr:NAD-dependent epimerase/dehydratase family protein [Tannerella sp.]